MTTQIKYLVFKGISKKEEILFKSFLNLIKRDIDYQIVVLKEEQVEADAANIAIIDEDYLLAEGEANLESLPHIIIGDVIDREHERYLIRPVQWSEFKNAIVNLDVDLGSHDSEDEHVRVLPSEIVLAISEEDEAPNTAGKGGNVEESTEPDYSDEGEYEYSLDKMSIDYHSFTNSDYVKVVDDVKDFKVDAQSTQQEAVILVTDDESNSLNSVLVIETNSMDAWDLSESDYTVSQLVNESVKEIVEAEEALVVDNVEVKVGTPIQARDKFWLDDGEIIVDNSTFMFVKPERDMVYSPMEPGKWAAILQRGGLLKAPIVDGWQPSAGLTKYPVSSLQWMHTLVFTTSEYDSFINDSTEYQLESWPHFDLLELDNILLKLCTMLYIRAESVGSLATKSGYGRSTIRGLMNACYQNGCLKLPEEIQGAKNLHVEGDESMLGKIKDVFR